VTRIVVFAKAPAAGRVKTRLIPALGAEGAAALAGEMLAATVEEALATGLAVELCGEPDAAQWHEARPGLTLTAQGEGGLGERLARAAERVLEEVPVLLIGADCPDLHRMRLRAAAQALEDHDAVLHPALDGGYALLGLRRFDRSVFEGIDWSTAAVAEQTTRRIEALGWALHVGEILRDVDEPEDLLPLPRRGEAGVRGSGLFRISRAPSP
jgi:rSAM/selenodomain-associated transferase 1